MEEVLQKLLEAEVLSADTKQELELSFKTKIDEAVKESKMIAEAETKADLAEQWITERDALIEAIDLKVSEFLNDELGELREDINRFRDLEVEYAEKLTEAKSQMSDELKGDLAQLVEKLDTFLEIRLSTEFEELKEDIHEQKQVVFGRKIFEAVAKEYSTNFVGKSKTARTLVKTKNDLAESKKALKLAESKIAKTERTTKLSEVLSPLSGRQREVMEAILKNVVTDQLQEGYKTFIGRVLKETVKPETAAKPLTEAKKFKKRELKEDERFISGQKEKVTTESDVALSESAKANLRKLAGM